MDQVAHSLSSLLILDKKTGYGDTSVNNLRKILYADFTNSIRKLVPLVQSPARIETWKSYVKTGNIVRSNFASEIQPSNTQLHVFPRKPSLSTAQTAILVYRRKPICFSDFKLLSRFIFCFTETKKNGYSTEKSYWNGGKCGWSPRSRWPTLDRQTRSKKFSLLCPVNSWFIYWLRFVMMFFFYSCYSRAMASVQEISRNLRKRVSTQLNHWLMHPKRPS